MKYNADFYQQNEELSPLKHWLEIQRDQALVYQVWQRLLQAQAGDFARQNNIAEGVRELRLSRHSIYFAFQNPQKIVFLLIAPHEQEYQAIKIAKSYWADSHFQNHRNNTPLQGHFIQCLKTPNFTWAFLRSLIASNSPYSFNIALCEVVKITGITKLSKKTGLSRQAIYRMIERDSNPTVQNLNSLLGGLDLQLCVENRGRSAL